MKKRIYLLFVTLICLFISPLEARIWTVDNSPGAGADTTDINGAIHLASSGDTIIVMPSPFGYSGISVRKKIFIYTRSHSNNNIDRDKSAVINGVSFLSGSEGSEIKGFVIIHSLSFYAANNIRAQNCRLYSGIDFYANNCIVEGCVITWPYNHFSINMHSSSYNGSPSNNIFTNNYIQKVTNQNTGSISASSLNIFSEGNSTNLISNNLIVEISTGAVNISGGGVVFFRNSFAKVYNNIFWSNIANRSRIDTLNSGSVFRSNLVYSEKRVLPALPGTGNINDSMPLFEGGFNDSILPLYGTNNDMRLKSNSPGRNAGTDSTDVGLFGGGYNFSIIGQVPGVVFFEDFEVLNPILKKGGTLRVRVNARKPD